MSPKQLNILICEALGWTIAAHVAETDKIHADMCWIAPGDEEWHAKQLPNHVEGKEAFWYIHQAEKRLLKDFDAWNNYLMWLYKLVQDPHICSLSHTIAYVCANSLERAAALALVLHLIDQDQAIELIETQLSVD